MREVMFESFSKWLRIVYSGKAYHTTGTGPNPRLDRANDDKTKLEKEALPSSQVFKVSLGLPPGISVVSLWTAGFKWQECEC